ncbi:hypothetical protein QJS04_geneDACA003919 [Acorus gramineus]|uniref:Uncharacterized protein n=1 Tax=Acorus gramineus TaxID=55184 RepID=A0AAV9BGC1_ACOGR|nr:hypothetical protein QJS04_geneDACA003919 [Acorus gramineus]
MASRGHIPPSPYEGRLIQAPGMMRHGPFPGSASLSHHLLDPLPPPQLLEKKLSAQGKEMEKLMMENQRLATTHVTLRRDLLIIQEEMQRLQPHRGATQAESEIQIRSLLEKIARAEAEIHASEGVREELRHAHMELNDLLSARQELTSQIQQASEELQKAHADVKKLPEMLIELDGLMQEHQKLRAAFEYEKGLNIDLVDKMRTMEKDLFSMMREGEKLRAEVMMVEKRAHGKPLSLSLINIYSFLLPPLKSWYYLCSAKPLWGDVWWSRSGLSSCRQWWCLCQCCLRATRRKLFRWIWKTYGSACTSNESYCRRGGNESIWKWQHCRWKCCCFLHKP